MTAALAEHVARIRLAAEAALYLRLNAGAGFAEGRLPAQVHLRDAGASARLVRGTLRPEGTHRKALAEVQAVLAAPRPAAGCSRSSPIASGSIRSTPR